MEGVIKICREGGGGEVMNKYWADGEINPTHTHTHAHPHSRKNPGHKDRETSRETLQYNLVSLN